MAFMSAKDYLAPFKAEINGDTPDLLMREINAIYPQSAQYNPDGKQALGVPFDNPTYNPVEAQVQILLGDFELSIQKDALADFTAQEQQKQSRQQQQVAGNRVEQDATTSQKYPEPQFNTKKFTSPIDLPDADSALATDYPNTIGVINDAGDFFKVNKKTGDLQVVHRSGTCIKIDANGNMTIHSTGSVKQVVAQDLSIQAGGGIDIVAKKGIYLDTGSENLEIKTQMKDIKIDAMKIETSAMQVDMGRAIVEMGQKLTVKGMVGAAGFSGG